MKLGITLGLGALAVAAVAVAATPLQDAKAKPRGDEKPAAGGAPDMAAMMEAMIKAGTPGRQHKELAQAAGEWNTHVKMWMDPTQPPQESKGTSRLELVFDGRYLIEHFSGEMPGMGPFHGMGILAYENVTGQYQHVWMDSMSTGMMFSTGKATPDGAVVFHGEYPDCMSGQPVHHRMVTRTISNDERIFEMYSDQSGQETKSMEITYTRAEAP